MSNKAFNGKELNWVYEGDFIYADTILGQYRLIKEKGRSDIASVCSDLNIGPYSRESGLVAGVDFLKAKARADFDERIRRGDGIAQKPTNCDAQENTMANLKPCPFCGGEA